MLKVILTDIFTEKNYCTSTRMVQESMYYCKSGIFLQILLRLLQEYEFELAFIHDSTSLPQMFRKLSQFLDFAAASDYKY